MSRNSSFQTHNSSSKQYGYKGKKHHPLRIAAFFVVSSFAVMGALLVILPKLRSGMQQTFSLHGAAELQLQQVHVTEAVFKDVPANHQYANSIEYLKEKGIIKGFEDKTFQPDSPITRAELVKLITDALGADPHPVSNSYCFKDVTNEWFSRYVCYAKRSGWVNGRDDGYFEPETDLTKAEALKIIMNAFRVQLTSETPTQIFSDVAADKWYAPYVWTAQIRGYADAGKSPLFHPDETINRGQVADMLARVLATEKPIF